MLVFTDNAVALVHLAFFTYHLLGLHREIHTEDLLAKFWQLFANPMDLSQLAEPYGFFWFKLLLLNHGWCVQVDQATDVDLCELNC